MPSSFVCLGHRICPRFGALCRLEPEKVSFEVLEAACASAAEGATIEVEWAVLIEIVAVAFGLVELAGTRYDCVSRFEALVGIQIRIRQADSVASEVGTIAEFGMMREPRMVDRVL